MLCRHMRPRALGFRDHLTWGAFASYCMYRELSWDGPGESLGCLGGKTSSLASWAGDSERLSRVVPAARASFAGVSGCCQAAGPVRSRSLPSTGPHHSSKRPADRGSQKSKGGRDRNLGRRWLGSLILSRTWCRSKCGGWCLIRDPVSTGDRVLATCQAQEQTFRWKL